MLNIFLFNNFFVKSSIFWENCEKQFWKHLRQFFRERRRLASKFNATFFYLNKVLNTVLFISFFKKGCIFWENRKAIVSGTQVLLRGRRRPATKMNITFVMGNVVLNIFHLTIFPKNAAFLEKMGKKIFGTHDHFLGEGVILH